MEESSEFIVEAREELMIPSSGGNPSLRIGHFLKPTFNSIKNPSFDLLPSSLFSETPTSNVQNLSLEVAFKGWLYPQQGYKTWEERLRSRYENQWRKAGIYQAIRASTYQIPRNQDLILGLAQKWYPKTNTFIFPWGEVTITLEDIMVCGGYSIIGTPVFITLESGESREKEAKLESARKLLNKTKSKKPTHGVWMHYFMENEGELEHEAFLSLWLSRYVFSGNPYATISKQVFPIAIQLARGTRIALAPAVLASVYRDLGLLNISINDAIKRGIGKNSDDDGGGSIKTTIWAPFQLVQIWALERFPALQQEPNMIKQNEQIPAKWHKKILKIDNMSLELFSAGNSFQWRPYTNLWPSMKFYGEKEKWVSLNFDSDEELQYLAYCLRPSELVGVDCKHQYLPHRVARQFGLDQEVPSRVSFGNNTPLVAWSNYSKRMIGTKLYVPSRTLKPNVTTRYLDWWKQSKQGFGDPSKDSENLEYTCIPEKLSQPSSEGMESENLSCPPGFPPKCDRDQEGGKEQYLTSHGNHTSFGNEVADNEVGNPAGEEEDRGSKRANVDANSGDVSGGVKCAKVDVSESRMRNPFLANGVNEELTDPEIEELEARICNLENIVEKLNAAKFGRRV